MIQSKKSPPWPSNACKLRPPGLTILGQGASTNAPCHSKPGPKHLPFDLTRGFGVEGSAKLCLKRLGHTSGRAFVPPSAFSRMETRSSSPSEPRGCKAVRPTSRLRLSLLRFVDSNLPGSSYGLPMDMRIPALINHIMLESNPLKYRILVKRLAVVAAPGRRAGAGGGLRRNGLILSLLVSLLVLLLL